MVLALLFVASAWLPKPPAAAESAEYLPPIRIHSDRKWPERIVFDTGAPMVRVTQAAATGDAVPPAPPPPAGVLPPDLREALAQMQPSDVSPPQPPKQAKQEPKHQRKLVRRQIARPVLLAARRSPNDWFGPGIW